MVDIGSHFLAADHNGRTRAGSSPAPPTCCSTSRPTPRTGLTAWFLIAAIESLTHRCLADFPDDDRPAFRDELIVLLTRFAVRGSDG
ncbi:hypothetical protein [Amycolatopsis sp. NPDC051071]|uniref:hypothetical protein n=1 Tax=Amycolatopsis sp. NPDC051071 TaxID=3154637 RepID=UPI0034433577